MGLLLAPSAQGQDGGQAYRFRLVSVSAPAPAASDASPAPSPAAPGSGELVGMNGDGWVEVEGDATAGPVTDGSVTGGGTFNHWDNAEANPLPKPLVASGTWTADSLVSFQVFGTYGAWAAGTLVMNVTLNPTGGDPIPAQLTVNCNIPPADLSTGLLEGFYLTMGDASFEPFGLGLTILTTVETTGTAATY
jgi:hypothetical protein